MQGNRDDQTVLMQKGTRGLCQPECRRMDDIMAIPVLERQHEAPPVVTIKHRGAPPLPGPGDRQAGIAMHRYRIRRIGVTGKWDPAKIADKARDEGRVPPAPPAQGEIGFHMGAADGAARRIDDVQHRLKNLAHAVYVPLMTKAPLLTDNAALLRNRRRSARAPVIFLEEHAQEEIKDRLSMVNKTFQAPAVISHRPDFWRSAFGDAHVVADEEVLDLDEAAHDLVIHAMCLHWSNDPVGQLIQARRALEPDGLFLAALFGGGTLAELRACLAQAEADLRGGLSARVAPMGEIRDLGALLQRAGFAMPVADGHSLTVSYESPMHLMHDLRAMGEASALSARPRHFTPRGLFQGAAKLYQQTHGDDAGRIPATFELIFLTGWSPADNQPRPLRPGSATARLADALGTQETPLRD